MAISSPCSTRATKAESWFLAAAKGTARVGWRREPAGQLSVKIAG
jgi:hypothetical protein